MPNASQHFTVSAQPVPPHNIDQLGQVFTPPVVVEYMLGLCQNTGRALEPSAGAGAFWGAMQGVFSESVGIELDARVAPSGVRVMDFFDLPESEQFDTILGNPPYVRFQDIQPATRQKLTSPLFDQRSNLFLFFIEKCVRHLKPGGELVFIVPREFIKLTAARKLNAWLYAQGSLTHFVETGDTRLFREHTPNCAIFRFEKGRMNRQMADGRYFTETAGQLMFLHQQYQIRLSDVFTVKVGAVSGADSVFSHPAGNQEFVCSKTVETGETRRMFYNQLHPHLVQYKSALLARRIRYFDENNWWMWGRACPATDAQRVYVNGKTRRAEPFFLNDCRAFDGSILALYPKRTLSRRDLLRCTNYLNKLVNWQEQGFVCDGRFLFSQRSLQNAGLPDQFAAFLPPPLKEST